MKVGIALGAGGARGLAHLGVLKLLEEEKIPIDDMTGSSIGAVVAAAYAQNPNANYLISGLRKLLDEGLFDKLGLDYLKPGVETSLLQQIADRVKKRIVINMAYNKKAFLKRENLRYVLQKIIGNGKIEDCKIPLGIVSTDIKMGSTYVFNLGDIIEAAIASCAVPGFLSPVKIGHKLLVDGGVSCPVPVRFLNTDIKIAVEVGVREHFPLKDANIIEIIDCSSGIMLRHLAAMMAQEADIAIYPDTKDAHWSDFDKADDLIKAGYIAAGRALPKIREALRKPTRWEKIKSYIRERI